MGLPLDISAPVADARSSSTAVVALETTVLSHGLPWPRNLDTARAMAGAVRDGGATPAFIGVLDGRVRVGLDDDEVERFARGDGILKASRRDLATIVASGGSGATTVAATMACAALAGIEVFATGGIGGVHRGAEHTGDVSADLYELARTPVTVVCSGAKAILDLPRTLELLETLGVPVVGHRTGELPAFFARSSRLALEARAESPGRIAAIVRAHRALGGAGIVIANPVPEDQAIPAVDVERWIARALEDATRDAVSGKAVTPYLLSRVTELSEGRTLAANEALLADNARVASTIATALTEAE